MQQKGFTLIELLVVISIISILSTIGFVTYQSAQKSSRDGKRIGDIQEIQKALEQYYAVNGSVYPGSGGAAGSYPTSVNSYFQGSVAPKDPGGTDYTYRICATTGVAKYIICSTSMEACTGSKCNAATPIPADACSGFTAGTAAYCASNLSN